MRGAEKTVKGPSVIGKVKETVRSKVAGMKKSVSSGVSHKTTGLRGSMGRAGTGGHGSAG